MISRYAGIAPARDLILLRKLGERLKGKTFLHVNSTRAGGGVAEILHRMIPILKGVGIEARWEVIEGDERFFEITKKLHNTLQGNTEKIDEEMWRYYFEVNRRNAERLDLDADAVLIHDPQPAPLIEFRKGGIWLWRCHIDLSAPCRDVCDMLTTYSRKYDASVFSVAKFSRAMGTEEFIIPPSIDPLAEKNRELSAEEIQAVRDRFGLEKERPILLQVSRFDRFKDPVGVIKAYRAVRKYNDCVLVLAGSPATDDPEGAIVLQEVRDYAADDPDIRILLLPPFSDTDINALQRLATVILQKSVREGFGLTVSEAMWKGKAVIGGATGGIPLQILHGVTGFLVHSVDGAAFRVRQLLNNPEMATKMGTDAREFVRQNFLITRHTRDYLSAWYCIENRGKDVIEL
ncbi:MAG: glycosyltransferase [Nitrospiraceae bacterium]|nr:glycosyltransferase [Nitrospiraceae bacterium]